MGENESQKEVVSFIKSQLELGYSVRSIEEQLIKKGYSKEKIRESFLMAIKNTSIKEQLIKYGIPVLIGILGLFFVLMILLNLGGSRHIEVKLEIKEDAIYAGENVPIELIVNNYGNPEEININAQIRGTGISKSFDSQVKDSLRESFVLEVPLNVLHGNHELFVRISTKDGLESSDRLNIFINPPKESFIEPPKQEDVPDENDLSQDESDEEEDETIMKDEDLSKDESDDEEDETVVKDEVVDDALVKDNQKYQEALTEKKFESCYDIKTEQLREECFSEVGLILEDYSICEFIEREDGRDICLVGFSEKEDVCDLIKNSSFKNTCEMIRANIN